MAEHMLQELCDIQMKAKNLSQQIHSSMLSQQGQQQPSNGAYECPTADLKPSSFNCPPPSQNCSPCPQQRRSFQCPPPPQQQQQQQQQQQCCCPPPPQQQKPQCCCPPPPQPSFCCPPPPPPPQCCCPPPPPQPQQTCCPQPQQQQMQCPSFGGEMDDEQNNIKVCEIDQSGSNIKIYNAGSKMEYVSGYFIVQTQKDCCLSIYKIPPCVYLSGQSCLRIWTCPFQNSPNKLPSDLVFKELTKWKNGADVLTTLYRCDGKPVSCLRGSYM